MIRRTILRNAFAALILVCSSVGCARDDVRTAPLSTTHPAEIAVVKESRKIPWIRYFQIAGKNRESPERIFLLYFTTDSCGPCDMMKNWTFSDKRVARAIKDFVPVRIRGDVELQPTRRFGVNAFPTVIFFSAEDGELDRKTGFRDADSMLQWMNEIEESKTTIAALNERLEKNPADLEALIGQARNYLDAGRHGEALELAGKAEEIAPGDPEVLALMGHCHLRGGEIEKAETAVDAALEADEQNEWARRLKIAILLGRADANLTGDRAVEAMVTLKKVLRMDPENFDALVGTGRALIASGELADAREAFKQASEVRPSSPLPHEGLGNCYQKAGDVAMAELEFLKAIDVEPKYVQPYFRLIELYEKEGKRQEMMEIYSRVLPLQPAGAHNEIAWLMATSEHAHIRDPEAAIEHASMAVELEPAPWYIDTLAEAFHSAGRHDTAIAVIKEAIAKKPNDMKYYEDQLNKFQKAKAPAAEVLPEGKETP
jgi:tetratricopeptide (TPR) repeat protein